MRKLQIYLGYQKRDHNGQTVELYISVVQVLIGSYVEAWGTLACKQLTYCGLSCGI